VTDAEKRRLRRELGLPEESRIVLFVGRIVVWKGVMVLLEAWKKIAGLHKQARLILAGAGGKGLDSCEPAAREFVNRSGLTSQTTFIGEVTNVRDYLRCADLFVFPSWDDGFSNSILEAMATSLPVIAVAKNAARDVIDSGSEGLLVEEKDPDQLAEALSRLLSNPDEARRMGKRARIAIEQAYSIPHLIRHYSEVLLQT
jgi:glycosyltransferase involved in cell wall biosynthesis